MADALDLLKLLCCFRALALLELVCIRRWRLHSQKVFHRICRYNAISIFIIISSTFRLSSPKEEEGNGVADVVDISGQDLDSCDLEAYLNKHRERSLLPLSHLSLTSLSTLSHLFLTMMTYLFQNSNRSKTCTIRTVVSIWTRMRFFWSTSTPGCVCKYSSI